MSRLTEIYEGWKNVVFPTPEVKTLAKRRIKVCIKCEHLNSLNICSKCHCPTLGKAHSLNSRCPMNKWVDGWGQAQFVKAAPPIQQERKIPHYIWNELTQKWIEQNENNNLNSPLLFMPDNLPGNELVRGKNRE